MGFGFRSACSGIRHFARSEDGSLRTRFRLPSFSMDGDDFHDEPHGA
jgi:hypothetical protein